MKRTLIPVLTLSSMLSFPLACLATVQPARPQPLPPMIRQIMAKPPYQHSLWAFYVKDLNNNKIIYDYNSRQMVSPASVTKVFTVSALLNAYGFDYRFKTPVYADGQISNNTLNGNLILVGKGDLNLGGRQTNSGHVAYTNFDHIDANEIPGAILTPQDPLAGFKKLAQQVKQAGINKINGQVLVDDRYFDTVKKRDNVIGPIMVNDNLLDFTATATTPGQKATLQWRPQIPQIKVINEVKTVTSNAEDNLKISANANETVITVKGEITPKQKTIVNVYPIKHPKEFATNAFKQALQQAGVTIAKNNTKQTLPAFKNYQKMKPIAELTSAPLIDTIKLILKVSHNAGANLVPLLLAAKHGQTSYDQGMVYLGNFLKQKVKLKPNQFSISEAAGADKNRINPPAAVQMLTYWFEQSPQQFKQIVNAMPILGVDGSLATLEKESPAKGHVYAKTGTNLVFDAANNSLYLTTKALSGYIQTPNGHWLAFIFAVNNAEAPTIEDLFNVLQDTGAIASIIYKNSYEAKTATV